MIRLLTTALCACAALLATSASGQTRIEADQTVSGALTPRDSRMYSGAHFELWIYSGSRGEQIGVTLRSIQFDAYLIVQQFPGGSSRILARDDDGAGGNDARVELTLPEDGDYVITVSSAQRGETGAYRLSVESSETAPRPRPGPSPSVAAPANSRTASPRGASDARMLVHGQAVTGSLSSSPSGPLGASEGDWRHAGRAGETITLDLRSSEFDPFLTLYSLSGERVTRVAQDDNGGGGLNSRIVYRIPADGEYIARAERRQPGRSGSYTLSLRSTARSSRLGARAEGNRRIPANAAVPGELDDSDPKMHDGTPYELWTYVGRAGETIRITLRSGDFDAFVSIGTLTNGVFAALESADDGAGGTNSRLDFTLPFAGEYSIRANSLSPQRPTGDYILRIDSLR